MKIRDIARRLSLARNTVRSIIASGGKVALKPRSDAIALDEELVRKLYRDCDGWVERVFEKLKEEHGVAIGYSTLTRKVRSLGLGVKPFAERVPDVPGGEMQHDTSPYRLKLGTSYAGVIASMVYYRYSKQYYLKFYRSFNRFHMKCFFHEALSFYGYSAPVCIIDNTHLAVLRGTGKNAVMVPEMIEFTKRYGFHFQAHEIKHSDRKAGNERGFWTVETNFFPGREFSSMEDLNAQALEWATVRMANRPRGKAGLLPAKAFEHEKSFLTKLPEGLPPPYRVHERSIDQYGYIIFATNHYWIPSGERGSVKVLEYAGELKIVTGRRELACYPLPKQDVRNKIFPENRPQLFQPKRGRDNASLDEERVLRAKGPEVSRYLDLLLSRKGTSKHRLIRQLFRLSQRLSPQLFLRVIQRAVRFRVNDMSTLEDMARLLVMDSDFCDFTADLDHDFQRRESFQEGEFTDSPDFSTYDQLLEEKNDG